MGSVQDIVRVIQTSNSVTFFELGYSLEEPAHKNHLFRNQTLVALF